MDYTDTYLIEVESSPPRAEEAARVEEATLSEAVQQHLLASNKTIRLFLTPADGMSLAAAFTAAAARKDRWM